MPSIRWIALKLKRRGPLFCLALFVTGSFLFVGFNSLKFINSSTKNQNNISTERNKFNGVPGKLEYSNQTNLQNFTGETRRQLNSKVHVFYYAWYGSPSVDGEWWHWNHEYIPPWDKNDHKKYPTGHHQPDKADIGANFYPSLGPYSSKDPAIISAHMSMMAKANLGVVALSWYPPGQADEHGPPSDKMVPALLDAALDRGLKVCLQIEPYEGRDVTNLRKHLIYVQQAYGSHPAYYKVKVGSRLLPLFYLYDSYRIVPDQWARLLSPRGDLTVRNTDLDGLFIGLLVEFKHRSDIKQAGFDGFYTYFASNGFSYGSSWKNWKSLASYAFKSSMMFIPSVGPGYVDTRVRAWNGKNTQSRGGGSYYDTAWRSALTAPAKWVSVTSFNEWHEGTQIEPAMEKECEGYKYEDYSPLSPQYYLELTDKWSLAMKNKTIPLARKNKPLT